MNKRLEKIASYITSGTGIIDVGTDHGYLPVWLAKNAYKGNIFASDINADPLAKAVRTAEAAQVAERINFMLCDGLENCPPEAVDTIVIAGMGGDSICGILDRAEWCMDRRYKLILQPMTKAEVLRYWLTNNEFEISTETLVKENDSLYQLFTARFGGKMKLSDAELFTGSYPLIKDEPLFPELLELLLQRFGRSLEGLKRSCNDKSGKISLIEGILSQLEEMKNH